MDNQIFFKIPYGLYVLTSKVDGKSGGCIINTAAQLTVSPNRISVTVNKDNYTCEMIQKSGVFNVNILGESAPFDMFKHFGFQSGKTVDKFADYPYTTSKNALPVLTKHICGYISGVVEQEVDLGTHILFIAKVSDGEVTSKETPMTYSFYHAHVKPQPKPADEPKSGWRCKTCGYVYEGDLLPEDYVCPLCKHGVDDFERIEPQHKTQWRCEICGYIYEGDELPADYVCPLCKHGASDFVKVEPKQNDKPVVNTVVREEVDGKVRWRCTICGFVYVGDELPEDYVCPLCGQGAEDFVKLEPEKPQHTDEQGGSQTKWRCNICGYVYTGDELPQDYTCPLCGQGADAFQKI